MLGLQVHRNPQQIKMQRITSGHIYNTILISKIRGTLKKGAEEDYRSLRTWTPAVREGLLDRTEMLHL